MSDTTFCTTHGKWRCSRCAKTTAAMFDYGLFVWRSDGVYPRAAALAVYTSKPRADRAAAKRDDVVVRTLVKAIP